MSDTASICSRGKVGGQPGRHSRVGVGGGGAPGPHPPAAAGCPLAPAPPSGAPQPPSDSGPGPPGISALSLPTLSLPRTRRGQGGGTDGWTGPTGATVEPRQQRAPEGADSELVHPVSTQPLSRDPGTPGRAPRLGRAISGRRRPGLAPSPPGVSQQGHNGQPAHTCRGGVSGGLGGPRPIAEGWSCGLGRLGGPRPIVEGWTCIHSSAFRGQTRGRCSVHQRKKR